MTTHRADKAGSWYPASAAELEAEIGNSLSLARTLYGPAEPTPGTMPLGIVVPHAGLAYSGRVAGAAFQLVRDAIAAVDAFVVFGACHRAWLTRPAVWPDGEWETPLGPVRVDADLAGRLIEAGVGEANPGVHIGDNAIELAVPFIKSMFPEAGIVPVAVSATADAASAGEKAFAALSGSGKTLVAVASTDLTHYGAAFDLMPVGSGPKAVKWTRENDRPFLEALTGLELDRIVSVAKRDSSACGAGAAAAAAAWAKAGGATSGRVLVHTNSYEIMPRGPADHMVGYAALVFEGPGR